MSKITHEARLRKRISNAKRGLNGFLAFLVLIADKNPKYCFLCGKYIHPSWVKNDYAFQPFGKKSDWVERSCYTSGITYEIANEKLSEESLLICHYEIFTTYHPEGLCRKKIKNNRPELMKHLVNHKGYKRNYHEDSTEMLQHQYFLKPTGKRFAKPRGN